MFAVIKLFMHISTFSHNIPSKKGKKTDVLKNIYSKILMLSLNINNYNFKDLYLFLSVYIQAKASIKDTAI